MQIDKEYSIAMGSARRIVTRKAWRCLDVPITSQAESVRSLISSSGSNNLLEPEGTMLQYRFERRVWAWVQHESRSSSFSNIYPCPVASSCWPVL